MKIRKLTLENHPKVEALLKQAFSNSLDEVRLFKNMHKKDRELLEWICIHRNTVVGYIAFSNAYNGKEVCGLHLAPLAVKPQMQHQGIGSELLRFALRQDVIIEKTLFVLGEPRFYQKFGFELCKMPICPFDKKNAHFLSIRNGVSQQFTIGYEPEFRLGG